MMRLLVIVPLILAGYAMYAAPQLSPRSALFGVRVRPEVRNSDVARRAIAMFRWIVLVGFLVALAVASFTPSTTASAVAPPIVLMTITGSAWAWQYTRLKRFAFLPPPVATEVEMSGEPDRTPAAIQLSLLPFALLLATALYLYFNRDTIPARFPVHWGADGEVNRWGSKTVRGVYGPLMFGALFNTWFVVLSMSVWHGVRRSKYRLAMVNVLTAAQFLIGVILCLVSLTPLLKVGPGPIAAAVMILTGGLVVFTIRNFMRTNALPDEAEDLSPESGWTGGFFYFNRADPALAVPRRDGMGYTVNFAHVRAWALMLAPFGILYISAHWLF